MRREYKLTDAQIAELEELAKSVPYLIANGSEPTSPAHLVNLWWQQFAKDSGFRFDTVEQVRGKDRRYFTAVEVTDSPQGDTGD
jgi:hypothetical protein